MAEQETPNKVLAGVEAAVTQLDTCRVLIVEDDDTFYALCARYLRRATAFCCDVVPAPTIDVAMGLCRDHAFDCLIVDYGLPDGKGTDFVAALSQVAGDTIPPAIVLTAGGGEEAAIQAVKVSATDFMTKSEVSRTSLVRAVENAVVKSRLRQSVAEHHVSLEKAYSELKKNSEEIRQFYQSVSHEVKTPLMAMQEFLMLIGDGVAGPVSEPQQELLNYALESCNQIASHFEDLLDVTRIGAGKLTISPALENPASLIRRCLMGAGGQASAKNVELIDKTSQQLPDLLLDTNRIMQVLDNLVYNAIKFTDSGGLVTVETNVQTEPGCFMLTVTDTGCGFDPALSERVFDRLYQIHHGVQNEAGKGGLGLGLSIAREIARLHGGTVDCVSTTDKGSVFRLMLPIPETQKATLPEEPIQLAS